ncbi:probable amino acid permease 7 isoform X2, partial [Tanacetum coccineum]
HTADIAVDHELLPAVSVIDDHNDTIRTGTLWSTIAHIITAVIGSGVLSLAWSMSQLGWIGGPLALFFFAMVTYVSSSLLADCYRSPDPVTGARNRSFADAVRVILGEKQALLCGVLQFLNFYGTGVAYVVTTATCMSAIWKSNCYHKKGHEASCEYDGNVYMFLFGVIQIVMSQIPDFHSMMWVSVVAAIMSFCYASIGFGLGVATVVDNGKIDGSIYGVSGVSPHLKLLLTFQALGDIAFAYPYSLVFLEIQDTLKSPPSENKVMKKASVIAIIVTTFFYLGCGCFGYAAFGENTPGNLLTGFGFYEPYWLIDFANACIILHLIGGYQRISEEILWLTTAILARFRVEPVPAMFQNILRCINNRSRNGVSILQRNIGSFRGFKFMAIGDIFTRGNVHSAKKGGILEPKMGAFANFQRCFNGDFHIGFNWVGFGTHRSEDKIID